MFRSTAIAVLSLTTMSVAAPVPKYSGYGEKILGRWERVANGRADVPDFLLLKFYNIGGRLRIEIPPADKNPMMMTTRDSLYKVKRDILVFILKDAMNNETLKYMVIRKLNDKELVLIDEDASVWRFQRASKRWGGLINDWDFEEAELQRKKRAAQGK